MSMTPSASIASICADHGNDRFRLMDILRAVQREHRGVDGQAIGSIAEALGIARAQAVFTTKFVKL